MCGQAESDGKDSKRHHKKSKKDKKDKKEDKDKKEKKHRDKKDKKHKRDKEKDAGAEHAELEIAQQASCQLSCVYFPSTLPVLGQGLGLVNTSFAELAETCSHSCFIVEKQQGTHKCHGIKAIKQHLQGVKDIALVIAVPLASLRVPCRLCFQKHSAPVLCTASLALLRASVSR